MKSRRTTQSVEIAATLAAMPGGHFQKKPDGSLLFPATPRLGVTRSSRRVQQAPDSFVLTAKHRTWTMPDHFERYSDRDALN
jgi:hypothetical protein